MNWNAIFSIFCVMFLLPSENVQRKQNLLYFVRSQRSPPLNSRVKNKTTWISFIPTIGLISPIKNIKQNIGKNIAVLVLQNQH